MFDSGVLEYIDGKAEITVHFPVDEKGNPHVSCRFCTFLSTNNRSCRLNGEIVEFPEKYIGSRCPLNFD